MVESRAGVTIRQREGYPAFIPKPLPPHLPLDLHDSLLSLLSHQGRIILNDINKENRRLIEPFIPKNHPRWYTPVEKRPLIQTWISWE